MSENMEEVVNNRQYFIRKMTENDISGALQVFASHGLYEAKHSMKTYLQIDCNAFYVAIDETNNKVIAVCGGPFIRPDMAFIGLYGVDSEYFGRGIGQTLFKCVMNYIGDRNCCLFSVPVKIPLYRDQLGFKLVTDHKLVVYFGKTFENNVNKSDNNFIVKAITDPLVDDIIDYDQRIHHYRRDTLLKLSLKEPQCLAMAALDTNTGRVVGYGCIREHSSMATTLSPVYADNSEIGKQLMYSLINGCENALKNGFFYYIIDTNVSALTIAQELHLEIHEVCPLLFRTAVVEVDYQKIYSVFSPNFSL